MWGENQLKRYRVVVIGGGPAGVALLVRAIRLGVMNQLSNEITSLPVSMGDESAPSSKEGKDCIEIGGLCMLDACHEDQFGGGRLQEYAINSNTNGENFVHNVLQDKPYLLPSETATGSCLGTLRNSPAAAALEDYKGYCEHTLPPLLPAYTNLICLVFNVPVCLHSLKNIQTASSSVTCSFMVT